MTSEDIAPEPRPRLNRDTFAGYLYHDGPLQLPQEDEAPTTYRPVPYNQQLMYQLTPNSIPNWTRPDGIPVTRTWSTSQYKSNRYRPILPERQ